MTHNPTKFPANGCAASTRQRGVALALCLVLLLVVTILGVTTLGSSRLEEGMSRNLQDSVDAFQVAETGAIRAIGEFNTFSTADSHSDNATSLDLENGREAIYTSRWMGETPPIPLDGTAFSNNVTFHHFEVRSDGRSRNNARNTVYRGGIRIGPAMVETETTD